MSSGTTCKECGTAIPADSPGGFCAQCLFGLGLDEVQSPESKVQSQSPKVTSPVNEKSGDRIGRYKLLQEIGHGGCGVVYMAEQEEPVRRKVALKVIKLGMDTRQVVARFEAERQALALMDHSNIAKVLDAGATDTGRPYFVMELVGGIKITDYCDQHGFSIRQRLDLFIQVCRAIQHAHQKGVIHRDIKPSNVLVANQDGTPVPKVIDFGIAKATQGRLTDETLFTAFEQFLGTPAYMSPEQTQLGSLDVDTRSDIYSLGVLLYELLTGQTPFDTKSLIAAGVDEMRRTIREEEPVSPSTRLSTLAEGELNTIANHRQSDAPKLIHHVRGDLDWIVMKCLEKDRARRYDTANGLASDIERHLNNEEVVASPPSRVYRLQKMIRRNRIMVSAVVLVAAALVSGVIVSAWQAWRATRAEQHTALEAAKSKQVAGFLKVMLRSLDPAVAQGKDTAVLREILDIAALRVGRELTNQPEVEFEVRSTLAAAYGDFGLYRQMEDMAQACLAIARTKGGEENLDVALALQLSGYAQSKLGNFVTAEATLRKALAMRQRILGKSDLDVAKTLNSLGNVLLARGKIEEAELRHRDAYAIRHERLGDTNEDVAESLGNIGSVLELQGRLVEAEKMQRQVVTLLTNLNPQHPRVPLVLVNLTDILRLQHRLAEAKTVCLDALDRARKQFGTEHPMLVPALNNLGEVLRDRRELAEAEKVLRETLDMAKKVSGKEHLDVAYTLTSLGGVLKDEYKLAEAEAVTREALRIRLGVFTNDHRSVAANLEQLSSIRTQLGDLTEAESLGQKAVAMYRNLLGPKHPELASALNSRAIVLFNQNKLVEAEEAFRESHEILRSVFGEKSPLLGASLQNMAMLLYKQSKLSEAVTAMREAIAVQRASSPNGVLPDPQSLDDLAGMLIDQGDFAGAATVLREALDMVQPATADPSLETELFGLFSHHLADVLRSQHSLTNARSLAETSVAAYDRHPQWPSQERRHAVLVLAYVLQELGDDVGLEDLYRRKTEIAILDSLAALFVKQGKIAEAERRYREALKLGSFKFGDPPQETSDFGVTSHHLADLLRVQKKFVEARSLGQDSVAAYRRHPEWGTGEAQHAVRVLEAVLTEMGDSAGLAAHYGKQVDDLRAVLPAGDTNLAAGLAQLALALIAADKFVEAESAAKECLEIRAQEFPDDWRTFNTRSILGGSLLGQKKYEPAEPLLLDGYTGMRQRDATIPEAGKIRLTEAAQRLVRLYEATNRPEQAAQWRRTLAESEPIGASEKK